MRRIFKIFCILFAVNLYGIFETGSVSGVPLGFTTVGVVATFNPKAALAIIGFDAVGLVGLAVTLGFTTTTEYEEYRLSVSERQASRKYEKKYILTKDSLKECDKDKNAEVCYRYARIFNLLKYKEEAKKYYDLSCKYGLDIACDIDMQEDLKRKNDTNYLKEYNLKDDIEIYNKAKQDDNKMSYCYNFIKKSKDDNFWWRSLSLAECYANYEYMLEHNNEKGAKYYKYALCMYGYEKYCDKNQDKKELEHIEEKIYKFYE